MLISRHTWLRPFTLLLGVALIGSGVKTAGAQGIVPGTGQKWDVSDDFEDENWSFDLQLPKSSKNIDGAVRYPSGSSNNNRILESTYRGTPDVMKRVPTPPGGLPGSKGSLLMQSLVTGIPGRPSGVMQQDDVIVNVKGMIAGQIQTAWNPSVVTRVYLPPFDEWEERTGSHFGFRIECSGWGKGKVEKKVGLFRNKRTVTSYEKKYENYWPGFFIQFNRKEDLGAEKDSAVLLIRGDVNGHEITGPAMEPGWWTLGMSVTGDGYVHYYARPGIENLRREDFITSQQPYGSKADYMNTFFFNIVNNDDGRTWSTKWIIDDPELFVLRR